MEKQLQNIQREMNKLILRMHFYATLLAFELDNYGKILSTDTDQRLDDSLRRYIILEEEQSFLEYVLTKTD